MSTNNYCIFINFIKKLKVPFYIIFVSWYSDKRVILLRFLETLETL